MADISTQLIEQVQSALADNTPLHIQGNNTKAGLGRSVDTATQTLAVNEHSGIVQYQPGELVLTVRAGTCLADIDAALAEHGQVLACDPRRYQGHATIGGSLATNQSGAARPWLGSLRDHVLGVKLINGQGEHMNFGGQVMKNVAGYDVSRLQAGAMGTLGVITEISLKVLPKPDASATLSKHMAADEALQLMNQLAGGTKPLTGCSWVDDTLYLRLQGSQQAVNATLELWQQQHGMQPLEPEQADTFWADLREHQLAFHQRNTNQPLWRFSVNPAAKHFLHEADWAFNWTGAQRWLSGEFEASELVSQARQAGGEVQLYEGGQRDQEVGFITNPVLRRLQQNVKKSLDPQGIFNPGRLYSWL